MNSKNGTNSVNGNGTDGTDGTDGIYAQIVSKVAELGEVEPAEVEVNNPLKELGIDSLMSIELVVFVEQLLRRQIPEERMGAIKTCADIFREVDALIGPAPA